MATLKQIIMLTEENNEINGLCWADWKDALNIVSAYAKDGVEYENEDVTDKFVTSVLERGIRSNGKTLPSDCGLYEHLIWGAMASFSGGGFWIDSLAEKYGSRDRDTFSEDY